jgi:hypothetical protein
MENNIINENGFAVHWSEYKISGCIKCGCDYCYNFLHVVGGGVNPCKCGECGEEFYVIADELTEFPKSWISHKVELIPHPRKGIPEHAFVKPDKRPEGEGEFFKPRGVGYDLAGFVECKESGQRIVDMFKEVLKREPKTWLDYRKHEPTWIQVKVQKEDVDLEELNKMTAPDGIITIKKIVAARVFKLCKDIQRLEKFKRNDDSDEK